MRRREIKYGFVDGGGGDLVNEKGLDAAGCESRRKEDEGVRLMKDEGVRRNGLFVDE